MRFINPGHTQQPPQISISVAQSPWEVLGAKASEDERPLVVRLWCALYIIYMPLVVPLWRAPCIVVRPSQLPPEHYSRCCREKERVAGGR